MTEVRESLETEIDADRGSPRTEEGFRRQHQNVHRRLWLRLLLVGIDDLLDMVYLFLGRFMVRTDHDLGQQSHRDKLNAHDY